MFIYGDREPLHLALRIGQVDSFCLPPHSSGVSRSQLIPGIPTELSVLEKTVVANSIISFWDHVET